MYYVKFLMKLQTLIVKVPARGSVNKRAIIVFVMFGFIFSLIIIAYLNSLPITSAGEYPIIIWWTPLTSDYQLIKDCGRGKCLFTDSREFVNETQAILFYGSNFNQTDLPLPRPPNLVWALLHEESPKNEPLLQHESVLKHFNYTSTFSRYSDVPLTLQYIKNLSLLKKIPIRTLEEKNDLKKKNNLASVLYMQSHCDAPSGRDEYIKELMNFIDIDSYGSCLNNKKLPEKLSKDYLTVLDSDELYEFLAPYKFHIAMENAVCNDYITEKLWRPLIIGSVPIYFGSPSIEDWLPNNQSAILVRNFASPRQLADYIKHLDENDMEYGRFLKHKSMEKDAISNERLKTFLTQRKDDDLFANFQCFVCNSIYQKTTGKSADQTHYDCGQELILPKMQTDMTNFYWQDIMKSGKLEAAILNEFLKNNKPFTQKEWNDKMIRTF